MFDVLLADVLHGIGGRALLEALQGQRLAGGAIGSIGHGNDFAAGEGTSTARANHIARHRSTSDGRWLAAAVRLPVGHALAPDKRAGRDDALPDETLKFLFTDRSFAVGSDCVIPFHKRGG